MWNLLTPWVVRENRSIHNFDLPHNVQTMLTELAKKAGTSELAILQKLIANEWSAQVPAKKMSLPKNRKAGKIHG